MAKKLFSIMVAAGLVAGALIAPPATAAPEIPETVQIDDPAGDANFINDGNHSATGPIGRDHTGPADASSAGDLLKIWFGNTADKVSVQIQTEAPPPTSNAVGFQVFTNPGEGSVGSNSVGCLRWVVIIPGTGPGGGSYQGGPFAKLHDRCNSEVGIFDSPDGEFVVEELPDGTGVTTLTFDRAASPLLGPDGSITAPYVIAISPQAGGDAVGFANVLTIDNTQVGTDYALVDGEEPPGKSEPPGKKKGCDKGKGKKKGCKKGGGKGKTPPGLACDPFTPGEAGADQPSVTVTDAATEEAPVEQTVTLDMSVADLTLGATDESSAYFNIQVDSTAADAGLYVLLEFPTRRDYDLNLLHPDGSYAARARAWNTVIEANESQISSTGHGGESTASSEKLVGIKTADCGGWTLRADNWLGEGGDLAVKVWLGEVQNDPQAEGEEPG